MAVAARLADNGHKRRPSNAFRKIICFRSVACTCVVVACASLIAGCSSPGKLRPRAEKSSPARSRVISVEVITVEQQAREEVAGTTTKFEIPWSEDDAAWERARLFLTNYGGGIVEASVGQRNIIGSLGDEASVFDYQIVRTRGKNGSNYEVTCESRGNVAATGPGDLSAAELNARNVARFIRTGTLELSMLARG